MVSDRCKTLNKRLLGTTASFYKEEDQEMRWYQNLYVGTNAMPHIQAIRRKAASGRLMAGVYYITRASVPGNLLDIFHNGMLKQPLFAKLQSGDVIGVAEGRTEALCLAEQIIWEVYRETGGFQIRSYFKSEDFVED